MLTELPIFVWPQNESLTRTHKKKMNIQVSSESIQVGDLVRIGKDEQAPCDVCLIVTASEGGACYIQTSNLDGETDYKPRQALEETHAALTAPTLSDVEKNIKDFSVS